MARVGGTASVLWGLGKYVVVDPNSPSSQSLRSPCSQPKSHSAALHSAALHSAALHSAALHSAAALFPPGRLTSPESVDTSLEELFDRYGTTPIA